MSLKKRIKELNSRWSRWFFPIDGTIDTHVERSDRAMLYYRGFRQRTEEHLSEAREEHVPLWKDLLRRSETLIEKEKAHREWLERQRTCRFD